jgi:hypothetical protein
MKSSYVAVAPVVNKTSRKRGHGKKSTRTKTRTSTQELALAKPLGCGKKFSARSSGLSVAENDSLGAAVRKPKHALNLFGSNSSASDDESASLQRPQRPRDSSVSKQIPELALVKGTFS